MSAKRERLKDLFEVDRHPLVLVSREAEAVDGHVVERLVFRTVEGEAVRGLFCRQAHDKPVPALLCIHAHGFRYEIGASELLDGRPSLHSAPGPAFAAAGFATLMIDMPTFGVRAEPGESTRAKARMWQGASLAGQMVAEQAAAFAWLAARDDVIAGRVGVYGISMGATLGYWLAAVEPRIAAVVHMCAYADFATLIEIGAHDLHGIYLTVPGLLNAASNGEIAGMVAPRPQFIGVGDQDPLTPPKAVDIALVQTRAAYEAAGAAEALVVHREADAGHQETPAMRAAVLEFLDRHLA